MSLERQTGRRRGRPPLTKNYADPGKSPMAHMSKQMELQGHKAFVKPTMRVGSSTPSPQKRKTAQSTGSAPHASPSSTVPKRKYGTVWSCTPTKRLKYKHHVEDRSYVASSPLALDPSSECQSDRFSLGMDMGSSPPTIATSSPHQLPNWSSGHNVSTNPIMEERPSTPFKMALSINSDGKASISGRMNEMSSEEQRLCASDLGLERNKIMTLLKQMKTTTQRAKIMKGQSNDLHMLERSIKHEIRSYSDDELDPVTNQKQDKSHFSPRFMPSSPFGVKSVKTFAEYNHAIDQILNDVKPPIDVYKSVEHSISSDCSSDNLSQNYARGSPCDHKNCGIPNQIQTNKFLYSSLTETPPTNQHFAFKFTGGDPLLPDDDDGNWNEMIHSQFLSPKKPKSFNTPPSFVSFNSPSFLSPQRRASTMYLNENIKAVNGPLISQQIEHTAKDAFNYKKIVSTDFPSSSVKESEEGHHIISSPTQEKDDKSGIDSVPSCQSSAMIGTEALNETLNNMHLPFDQESEYPNKDYQSSSLLTPRPGEPPQTVVVGCTPLIQYTMNGSLNTRFIPHNLLTSLQSKASEPLPSTSSIDDASFALKRLIDDN